LTDIIPERRYCSSIIQKSPQKIIFIGPQNQTLSIKLSYIEKVLKIEKTNEIFGELVELLGYE
jgi:hypothetical protein